VLRTNLQRKTYLSLDLLVIERRRLWAMQPAKLPPSLLSFPVTHSPTFLLHEILERRRELHGTSVRVIGKFGDFMFLLKEKKKKC
jgi:hypothetical protein